MAIGLFARVGSATFVQRFQREVEAVARLSHPNIVMAYDADEAEIGHFLVMEYVDGRDRLSRRVRERARAGGEAVQYVAQAARALDYASPRASFTAISSLQTSCVICVGW